MLFALLDTGVSGVCIHCAFFAMQKLGDLCDIGHIGCGAMDVMNQAGLSIDASAWDRSALSASALPACSP